MHTKDIEVFNEMPFLFWAKDEEGKYLWGNHCVAEMAGEEDVVGKTDADMPWAENAEHLREIDKEVLASGKPKHCHEHLDKSTHGETELNVCKWPGELEGHKCCFGISFEND